VVVDVAVVVAAAGVGGQGRRLTTAGLDLGEDGIGR